MTHKTPYEEGLAKLKAQFRQRAAGEGAELLNLVHRPHPGGEELARIRFLSHMFAGTAPMFDYSSLGQAASDMEDAIRDAVTAHRLLSEAEQTALERAAMRFAACYTEILSE